MQRETFRQWVHNIFTTQEEEIDCGQLFETLSQFVDMEITGEDAARLLPYVHQHLEQCPECEDLHQALHEIARLEAQDELPEVEELVNEHSHLIPEHVHPHDHAPPLRQFRRWLVAMVLVAAISSIATALLVGYLALRTDMFDPLLNIASASQSAEEQMPEMTEMEESQLARLYDEVSPSVVFVGVRMAGGEGSGSGIVIDEEGLILTNNHVIEDADEVTIILNDGQELEAELVGRDPPTDLALLRVEPMAPLVPARLGDSNTVQVGELAVVIGSPFGFKQTFTAGYVSAVGRRLPSGDLYGTEIDNVIQTDATVNPGNSGGPLLNAHGEVIGVTTAIFSLSGGFQGIGFAVPINTATEVMPQLLERGYVSRPFLGIAGLDLTSQLARRLGLPVKENVLVQQVYKGSAADEAGVQAGDQTLFTPIGTIVLGGDILTTVAGQPTSTMAEANRIVQQHAIGDGIDIEVLRDGETLMLHGTLGEHPKPE